MFTPPQISIRKAALADVDALVALNTAMGHSKDDGYFETCFARQEDGSLDIYIAAFEGQDVIYGLLNWQPKYKLYDAMNIPAIQDLNVLQKFRRRGIATAMIKHMENIVREKGCAAVGISVGLTANYGAAQRIYTKLGYIPDGQGITYDRKSVKVGEFRPIDDNLCLMMMKKLA